jgi:hypothetical protein
MKFQRRPAIEPDIEDTAATAGTWKRVLTETWSALTSRRRAEPPSAPVTPAVNSQREIQRRLELRERREQEAQEKADGEARRREIAAALERRVRTHGSYFPGDPL